MDIPENAHCSLSVRSELHGKWVPESYNADEEIAVPRSPIFYATLPRFQNQGGVALDQDFHRTRLPRLGL